MWRLFDGIGQSLNPSLFKGDYKDTEDVCTELLICFTPALVAFAGLFFLDRVKVHEGRTASKRIRDPL